jgi:hypothetical protein
MVSRPPLDLIQSMSAVLKWAFIVDTNSRLFAICLCPASVKVYQVWSLHQVSLILKGNPNFQHNSLLKLVAHHRQNLYAQKNGANDSILNQIGSLQKEIERLTYEHFKEVRQICTPNNKYN